MIDDEDLVPAWVRDEHSDQPLVAAGWIKDGAASPEELIAIQHLLMALGRGYRALRRHRPVDILISNSDVPAAKALRSRDHHRAVVVVSHGMLRAIAALAARLALQWKDALMLGIERNPIAEASQQSSASQQVVAQLRDFSLSATKKAFCGLDAASLATLSQKLAADRFAYLTYLELLCAGLEFAVLHELGHVCMRHHHARELFVFRQKALEIFDRAGKIAWTDKERHESFRPQARLNRCLEHQADYFAMRAMFAAAPLRPYRDIFPGHPWADHVFKSKLARRNLALAAAGISFALLSLVHSPEPVKGDLALHEKQVGHHPLPSIRLHVATWLLGSELSTWRRLLVWPTGIFREGVARKLSITGFLVNGICLALVKSDWEKAGSKPPVQSPGWNARALEHYGSLEDILGPDFRRDYDESMRLVRSVKRL